MKHIPRFELVWWGWPYFGLGWYPGGQLRRIGLIGCLWVWALEVRVWRRHLRKP